MKALRSPLGMLVLLILGSAILNAAIFQFNADNRARAFADADRDLIARAQSVADTIDRTLQMRMIETFTFAALPSLRAFAASDAAARVTRGAAAREELRAIVSADENIRAATIVDTTGKVLMTTDDSILADWSDRVFVREALRGHLHASVPARDFGEISLYYSAPLLNNAGDVAGALVLRVTAQELGSTLGTYPNILLVDEDGVRLADRTNQPQPFVALAPLSAEAMTRAFAERRYGTEITQIRATNLGELRDEANRGRATPMSFRDTDGKTVRAALWRIKTNFWTVIVIESEDAITAQARAALFDMIVIAAITLVIALALGFATARFLSPARGITP